MNKILLEINNDKNIIKLLKTFKINIYNITYKTNKIQIKINKKDIQKISKITKYTIIKEYGLQTLKEITKTNTRRIFLLILFIIASYIISNLIVKIEIITDNIAIKNILLNELEEQNIKEYSFKKTNDKLDLIKQNIKKNQKEKIEWFNIKKEGMIYKINVEEKIIANKEKDNSFCNVIAKQEGIITKIVTTKGTTLAEQNEHVKKGDVLISGETYFNEELKKEECATGKAYAKTWYTINLSIPKTVKENRKLKKYRYNIYIKSKNKTIKSFKHRVNNPIIENKYIIKFFNKKIIISKEYESKKIKKTLSKKEIKEYTTDLIDNKISKLLEEDSKIIEQKVLKKNEFNSTIELEIFLVTEELISTQIKIAKEEAK